jgi:hypothetical protein
MRPMRYFCVVSEILRQIVSEILRQIVSEILRQIVSEILRQIVSEILRQILRPTIIGPARCVSMTHDGASY